MFQNLDFREYEIAGNILRAWYDEKGLAFVVDETIDEYKPNVLLVVRPQGSRRWDDLLQNVYNIDLEVVRPKRDNKYQKLDVEYSGIDVYENLIRAYEDKSDVSGALEDLIDFRDAAVRRAATLRLTTAQDEIVRAKITEERTAKTIKNLNNRMRHLRDKLAQQKSDVGREPTKQSASKILRTEAQIESVDEKLDRAEKRLENAQRRVDLATEEIDKALALLALCRASFDVEDDIKHKVIDARTKKSDVAKMAVADEEVAQESKEENEEPQEPEMSDKSEEVKPLLDKDPEILDDEIAFKPVDFDDIKPMWQDEQKKRPMSPYDTVEVDEPDVKKEENSGDEFNDIEVAQPVKEKRSASSYDVVEKAEESDVKDEENQPGVESNETSVSRLSEMKRPLSPFAATVSEEPQPSAERDDGDKEETPFGFPDEDSDDELQVREDDSHDDDYEDRNVEKFDEPVKEPEFVPVMEPDIEFEDRYSSKPVSEYSDDNEISEEKPDKEDNYEHPDFDSYPYEPRKIEQKPVQEPVIDAITSVDESEPADVDNTGQFSTEQYSNDGVDTPSRPFSPVEVPKMPKEETRPMSPRYTNSNPRPVGEKRSGFAYYILLILLIALSIFTLWLYQKKHGGPVPFPENPVEQPEPKPSPEPLPVEPGEKPGDSGEPDVSVTLPSPGESGPVDKPIDIRYPNDDILRGPEPDVPVVEPEEDVLSRKSAYGVSRDDIPVLEPVIEEPVVQVTTVTLPDVIVEENIVSVPMPLEGEDVETVVNYDNPANVTYVEESYVVEQPQQYVPEPQYVQQEPEYVPETQYVPQPQYAPQPQYVQEDYNYVEEREPVDKTRRDFTIHDGGQYSVTETVTYHAD